jgi:hypothetical protein
LTVNGSLIGPRRINGEKHSRIVENSLADFCHEYHRQTSPGLQYPRWLAVESSKSVHAGLPELPEKRLPHWPRCYETFYLFVGDVLNE